MALFSKRRSDGELVRDADPMGRLMPYIMKRRNESAVYYRIMIDTAPAQEFIRENRRAGKRITMMNVMVAALLQAIYRRPRSNRFVVGRRLYQRHSFDVSYVVKESLDDDAPEVVAQVNFDKNENIYDVAEKMTTHISAVQTGADKGDDKLFSFFGRTPRWFLRSVINLLSFMDFHNILPNVLRKVIPFYSSAFISHLGSIGADAPYHHLYEFGTTSIFLTIGRAYDKPAKASDGSLEWKRMMDIAVTIDERICDGYYLIKTLKTMESYIRDPWKLIEPVTHSDDEEEAKGRRFFSKKENRRRTTPLGRNLSYKVTI